MIMTAQLMTQGDIILQAFWHITAVSGAEDVQCLDAVNGNSYGQKPGSDLPRNRTKNNPITRINVGIEHF